MYRACISVAFALRGNRDESWRWCKERTARVDRTGSRKKYKVLESGDLVTGRNLRPYRRAVGVVAKEKVEVFESCVVAWCKRGLRGKVLVEELQRASIVGCSLMRAAGDSVVLMFSSTEERWVFLDRIDLDQWFARVTVWNPEEDQMTRMNPLYCTSGEEDNGRDGEVAGMADEFDIVGVVTPEPRLCEPEMWWQCTSGLWVAEAVSEV
ncbi:hypothetical protein V6N13_091155 [Hibiscus sabdariffa]